MTLKTSTPILCLLLISIAFPSAAQKNNKIDENALIERQAVASFKEFRALLSLPNDAHFPQDIEKNIQWCEAAFSQRGFVPTRLYTPTVPLLLAERKAKKAVKTVLVYLQIDGQPVDPSKWFQESPWTPTLKELDASGNWNTIEFNRLYEKYNPDWRIFARSTSDAKGPAVAFLAALDAMLEAKVEPNYNIKVIMDFEEELGSPQLPEAVKKYKNERAADLLIIFDGPRHVSNQPTLSFGARGICEITLTTYGTRQPVHSGNYGNYTPNPAMRLAQLLAAMKDDEGRVTIPGFYDGTTLTEKEKKELKQVPDDENEIKKFLGIAQADKVGDTFQESLQYPTLNIRGLDALYVGEKSRTLIPAEATAEIDIRLVPTSNPERLIELVRKQVESKGYHLIEREPTEEVFGRRYLGICAPGRRSPPMARPTSRSMPISARIGNGRCSSRASPTSPISSRAAIAAFPARCAVKRWKVCASNRCAGKWRRSRFAISTPHSSKTKQCFPAVRSASIPQS